MSGFRPFSRRDFLRVSGAAAVASGTGCLSGGERPYARIGVVSDTHVAGPESAEGLRDVLGRLRDAGVDAVLHCGDVTNLGYRRELEAFTAVWRDTMPAEVRFLFALGNRDVSDTGKMTAERKARDAAELLVNSPLGRRPGVSAHDVNGLAVVISDWKHEGELEGFLSTRPELRDPSRPLVVVQHHHPRGTVFGAEGWMGDDGKAGSFLKMFPNALSFSGHSHFGILQAGSLWRAEFAAAAAGSFYLGPSGPAGGREFSVLECFADHLRLVREDLATGRRVVELFPVRPWRTVPPKRAGQFAFVQWNLGHFSFGRHGGTAVPAADAAARAAAWRRQIAALDADFIGMSEYDPTFDLGGGETRRLLFDGFSALQAGPHNGYQCNAVAARRAPLSAGRTVAYAARKQQTYFLATETEIGGERALIVETHLDLSLAERTRQIKTLAERFGREKRVIVSGDFNVGDLAEYRPFSAAGFQAANGGRFGTFPTHRRRDMKLTPAIDNVFFRGFALDDVIPADGALELSDHRPLVAVFHA